MQVNSFFLFLVHNEKMVGTSDRNDEMRLFQKYLDVCNSAMEANKTRFPFKQILAAARKNAAARTVEVQIIDDRPSADIMIRIKSDKITAEDHKACPNCQCDAKWSVNKSYLLDVVNNPDVYIQNPARIDWDWIYDTDSA